MPYGTSDRMPDGMSENMSDRMPERMPEEWNDRMYARQNVKYLSDRMPLGGDHSKKKFSISFIPVFSVWKVMKWC